jgi:hypothetical protein
MLIEYPYTQLYTSAYLVSSQGRRTVCLVNKDTKERTSTSYARYMMAVNLKRFLTSDEHVDHINEDKADDRIENYQILTPEQNKDKWRRSTNGRKIVDLRCPVCSSEFTRKDNQVCTKSTVTCSRSCGGKASHNIEWQRKIILKQYYSNELPHNQQHTHNVSS